MLATPWSFFSPFAQTIGRFVNNPVTDWQRFYSPQVIFNYNPEDEPIETHVLSRVGSYGSQLSTLIDVIDVLVGKLDRKGLSKEQTGAIEAFTELRQKAEQAVDEARGMATPEAIVEAVQAIAKRHPEQLPDLKEKLEAALA